MYVNKSLHKLHYCRGWFYVDLEKESMNVSHKAIFLNPKQKCQCFQISYKIKGGDVSVCMCV